ncbi:TPA: heme utilization protein [Morganella morganii subsp. morganii]|uniref:Heme utilization protein n=1 Tax=Morganella morganii TaxID=582 RepID=A0AAU8ZM09_MORMO|nr:heme utilization protein [Morganella morganii]HDU8694718.1 heme utilization protein [Morganella morganii subsp. morganii]AWC93661.1 heme utilization protein [Morganella morganii]EKW8486227.1 heme utilization protein [Morganella morganii]HAT3626654.1 heme utilization protein [Morganella morganii]HCU0880051.1 heme utilization protein [Morganella morganii]
MKNKIIAMALVVLSGNAYAHYQVENVKTTTRIFSFELVHKYLNGHESHQNTCRKTYTNNKLESCTLNYKVTSGGNNKVIKTGFVDLRGDGSFDQELMNATTHYNALRVAEAHGVDLTQLVEIPREDITSLTGGNNRYTVDTSSAGRVCDANSPTTCRDYADSGYTNNTLDFTTMKDLQVACEFTSKDISVKTSLSEDNLYLYNGATNQKILSYNYDVDNVSVDCVNWLSTAISKDVTLKYEVLDKTVTDGDTQLTCKLFGNNTGTTSPSSSTNKMTIQGFSTKDENFKIPEAFLGFYVSSPSGSAQTSVSFDCNFPLSTEIK